MNPVLIETWTQIMQNIFESIALLAAAGWAIYNFKVLGQALRSRLDIQSKMMNIEAGKFELEQKKYQADLDRQLQDLKMKEVMETSIQSYQQTLSDDQGKYVSTVVHIENKGLTPTRLDFDPDRKPFFVYAVNFLEDGTLIYEPCGAYPVPIGKAPNDHTPALIVPAGGSERISFFFAVNGPGLYYLVFSVRSSKKSQSDSQELGARNPVNLVAKEYFVVH